jgi:putative Ca2+/H+ antiporter (TMEM165/GDT1 family)
MDFKLLATTFVAIFIAELGDKTQLATVGLAGSNASKWTVFLGASLALVATSAIGVLAGGVLSKYVPPLYVHKGAGVLFVVIGVVYLVTRPEAAG